METTTPNADSINNEESVARRTILFERYVLPHINLIYTLCIRYSFSSDDVDDNYNEVLVNFFKYIETYDPNRSIQTWLHIVTKRFVFDLNIRKSHYKKTDDVDITTVPDNMPEDNGVSGNYMGMENYEQYYNDDILDALNQIKPIYREALLLQQAGYKLHEIMEITYKNGTLKAKNIDTVKSRLFLAKQQMRNLINRDGEARAE